MAALDFDLDDVLYALAKKGHTDAIDVILTLHGGE